MFDSINKQDEMLDKIHGCLRAEGELDCILGSRNIYEIYDAILKACDTKINCFSEEIERTRNVEDEFERKLLARFKGLDKRILLSTMEYKNAEELFLQMISEESAKKYLMPRKAEIISYLDSIIRTAGSIVIQSETVCFCCRK